MRIFKNRGDIYFSKTNKEKSKEQRILISALVFIVIFTIVFIILLGIKNNFSAKEFFKPDNLEITEVTEEYVQLPEVSGKSNFIVMVNNEDNLLFVSLIQVDLDNLSYKSSMLRAYTEYDGSTFDVIYKKSGAENLKNAIETYLNIHFDYYIDMEYSAFTDFYDKMGAVTYLVTDDIKFKDNDSEVPYSVRLKSGNQRIKGASFINLQRYYLATDNFAMANDLMLNSMLQHINFENLQSSEKLFSDFVKNSDTNISVRNFSLAGEALIVLADDSTTVKAYSAEPKYKNNEITKDGLKNIKGYFAK